MRRYVFADEAAASDSADGRSSAYVVARSPEEALEQAQSRHASHNCVAQARSA